LIIGLVIVGFTENVLKSGLPVSIGEMTEIIYNAGHDE
jgi:hypothetical protein